MATKWFCDNCRWRGTGFYIASACPDCREVRTMREACEEADCWKAASCGVMTVSEGYRRTCFEHWKPIPD